MDKKFVKVSISILIVTLSLVSILRVILKNNTSVYIYTYNTSTDEVDYIADFDGLEFEIDRHGKVENGYEIIMEVRNNKDFIASIYDVKIEFKELDTLASVGIAIDGYENIADYELEKIGIDPGEITEYKFFIPDSISFDKNVDLNSMRISLSGNDYLFRTGKNILISPIGSYGASENIKNNIEPIIINKE